MLDDEEFYAKLMETVHEIEEYFEYECKRLRRLVKNITSLEDAQEVVESCPDLCFYVPLSETLEECVKKGYTEKDILKKRLLATLDRFV